MPSDDRTTPDASTRATEQADAAARHDNGPTPTEAEEQAAERAEASVDVERVGEKYQDYLDKAVDVPGEGQIS